ncbi:MAG: hypothetical protein U5K30_09825 [Acidimicrobiales bacterium]|nr:hypothetical protein [Acidimicrobiales bacterium]MDZ7675352.1 hypothetical protein [Acidimicrobiales bacterium]
MSPEQLACQRRHPSARWPFPPEQLRSRVAQALDLHGAGHADVAASVLEARGSSGLDPEQFAARHGVGVALLARAEAGELALVDLPSQLRRLLS